MFSMALTHRDTPLYQRHSVYRIRSSHRVRVGCERLFPATRDQLLLRSLCFSRSRMIGFSNTGDTALRAWFCCAAIGTGLLCGAALGAEPVPQPTASAGTLSLTVDEATALFL